MALEDTVRKTKREEKSKHQTEEKVRRVNPNRVLLFSDGVKEEGVNGNEKTEYK